MSVSFGTFKTVQNSKELEDEVLPQKKEIKQALLDIAEA